MNSFTLDPFFTSPPRISDEKPRILVTGAAGRIGTYFVQNHNAEKYNLRLLVREEDEAHRVEAIRSLGEVVVGNIADLETIKPYFEGVDMVLHLAASAGASSVWGKLLPNNIIGTYNVFAAAKAAGCRRVLFASSIHAVSGGPTDEQVKTSEPPRPGDLYGVSKCFGESLARYMAEQEGLSSFCIRIGSYQQLSQAESEESLHMMDTFISPRDLLQLFEKCLEAPDTLRFAIFHGVSNNGFKRLDISDARQLIGYDPQDDFTAANPQMRELHIADTLQAHSLKDRWQKSGLRDDI